MTYIGSMRTIRQKLFERIAFSKSEATYSKLLKVAGAKKEMIDFELDELICAEVIKQTRKRKGKRSYDAFELTPYGNYIKNEGEFYVAAIYGDAVYDCPEARAAGVWPFQEDQQSETEEND